MVSISVKWLSANIVISKGVNGERNLCFHEKKVSFKTDGDGRKVIQVLQKNYDRWQNLHTKT